MLARPLWLIAGIAALACGAAGAVLPLLPATPFLLIAAFAFARSSPRLEGWLLSHRHFGPLIENWRRHGAIDRRAKRLAVLAMASAPAITWLIDAPLWTFGLQVPALAGAAAFVLTRPDAPAPREGG